MQNILKSTIRNFIRKPATNLINLLGLAVSLALVIILSVYSYSELTTDHFQKNGDRVYLCVRTKENIYTPALLKEQIDISVPGIESSVRIAPMWETPVFQLGEKEPIPSDLIFADENMFKLFTYKTIAGDLESALKEPMTLVITQTLAKKLFGNDNAVGKSVKLNNDRELTVKAVIEEPQYHSVLSFSAVSSVASRKIVMPNGGEFTDWGWGSFQTFLLLKKEVNPRDIEKGIQSSVPEAEKKNYAEGRLIPFNDLYFSKFSLYSSKYLMGGNKLKVMTLLMVALLVLIVALINFINISSSQWHEKIRQTGVMKVIGAKRSGILKNILMESFVFFILALLFSMLSTLLLVPFIQGYTGIRFNPKMLFTPSFLLLTIVVTFVLSTVFSLIPAIRISASKATDNLKKTVSPHSSNFFSRGILVTAQFAIAIVLIAFTVLVQKQINFGSSDLGMKQGNIVGIKLTRQLRDKEEVLRKILQEKPGLENVSFTEYYPGGDLSHWNMQSETNGEKVKWNFDTFCADANFLKILGLQLTMGRFYLKDLSTDVNKVVVNEAFVREHKLDNPIGCKFYGFGGGGENEIIGVVKDFHYKPVNEPITSLAIRNESSSTHCLVSLQISDFNSLHLIINSIRDEAGKLSPSFPVEVSFFDQAVENLYQSELQFRRTFSLFAGSAIVICCMGILAMSMFACQRRIKEIGIRKVNGAKISEVMTMLNRDFVKWVAIAFIIATPIAYYTMHKWLENFAYKTELSWWIFALAGLLALGIALLTVSWQSWRAATRNPVEALRYE